MYDPSGNVIIANEGTTVGTDVYSRGTLAADNQLAEGQTPAALTDAVAFARHIQTVTGKPIYLTGHSLGGTEAEAQAQALGPNFAGGMTWGATGLPHNTAAGPSSLIDYVDWGDPIGNWSTDASSPFLSLVPGNGMQHYGLVQMTGSQSSAGALRNAATLAHNALTAPDSGAYLGAGGAAIDSLGAIASVAGNIAYHERPNYASDTGITSLNTNPTPPGDDGAALFLRLFTFSLSDGMQDALSATVSTTSSGTLNSPDVNISFNPTTDQVTIDQLKSDTTVSGATQAPGVVQLIANESNGTSAMVAGPNAGSATLGLSGNTFDITQTAGNGTVADMFGSGCILNISNCYANAGSGPPGVTVEPGFSGTVVGNTNAVIFAAGASGTMQGQGNYGYAANGDAVSVGGTGDYFSLGTSCTLTVLANTQVGVASNSSTVNGGSGDTVAINGSHNTLTEGSSSTWTVNGGYNQLTISAASSTATLNAANETVTANGDTVHLAANKTATVTGNNNTLTVGTSAAMTSNGTGETVTASGGFLTLGNNSTASISGDSNTVNTGTGVSATVTGNSNSITLGSSSTGTVSGTQDHVTARSDTVGFGRASRGTIGGPYNTVNLAASDKIFVNGGGDVINVQSGDVVYLASNNLVTIVGSGATIVGNTGDQINVTGTNDNIYADSSVIHVHGTNTGDIVQGGADTGYGWAGYTYSGAPYGGYAGGGYYNPPHAAAVTPAAVTAPAARAFSVGRGTRVVSPTSRGLPRGAPAGQDIAAIAATNAASGQANAAPLSHVVAGSTLLYAAAWDRATLARLPRTTTAGERMQVGPLAPELGPGWARIGTREVLAVLGREISRSQAASVGPSAAEWSATIARGVGQLIRSMAAFSASPFGSTLVSDAVTSFESAPRLSAPWSHRMHCMPVHTTLN